MTANRKKRRERKLRQRRVDPKRVWAPPGELHEVEAPERLAYSRKQAAEALGVSISTIDRRVVPSVSTVKTPWGQRLIPAAELERFLREHLEPPHEQGERGSAGRPPTLSRRVVERIRLQYARGDGLAAIARALNNDAVPTAHGGRQWWPSTVRAVLIRLSPLTSAEMDARAAWASSSDRPKATALPLARPPRPPYGHPHAAATRPRSAR